MDFDPRITSDGNGNGAPCDGNGHENTNHNVTNAKCCIHVLRILISNADGDIHELEDELAILQCQLKWVESDKQRNPHEVCCAAFWWRIARLTDLIQSLMSGNVPRGHDKDEPQEIQKPAERICDIINALIRHNFSDPDEQPANTVPEESSLDAARDATRDSNEGRKVGKSTVEVTGRSERKAFRCTYEGKTGFSNFSYFVMTQTHLQPSYALGRRGSEKSPTGTEDHPADEDLEKATENLFALINSIIVSTFLLNSYSLHMLWDVEEVRNLRLEPKIIRLMKILRKQQKISPQKRSISNTVERNPLSIQILDVGIIEKSSPRATPEPKGKIEKNEEELSFLLETKDDNIYPSTVIEKYRLKIPTI